MYSYFITVKYGIGKRTKLKKYWKFNYWNSTQAICIWNERMSKDMKQSLKYYRMTKHLLVKLSKQKKGPCTMSNTRSTWEKNLYAMYFWDIWHVHCTKITAANGHYSNYWDNQLAKINTRIVELSIYKILNLNWTLHKK